MDVSSIVYWLLSIVYWIVGILLQGSLLGPFLGVFLAFVINNVHQSWRARKRRLFFRDLLLHEIHRSSDRLKTGYPNPISIDAWNSLVNSGDMALFARDLVIDLSDIYSKIQNYNYEVNWGWQNRSVDEDKFPELDKKGPEMKTVTVSRGPMYLGKYRTYMKSEYPELLKPELLEGLTAIEEKLNARAKSWWQFWR